MPLLDALAYINALSHEQVCRTPPTKHMFCAAVNDSTRVLPESD